MSSSSAFESLIDSTPSDEIVAQAEIDAEDSIVTQEDAELNPLEVGQEVYTPDSIKGEVVRFTAEGEPIVLSDAGEQVFRRDELSVKEKVNSVYQTNTIDDTQRNNPVDKKSSDVSSAQISGDKEQPVSVPSDSTVPLGSDAPEIQGKSTEVEAIKNENDNVTPNLPIDEKGNVLYHKMPVDDTLSDILDGELNDNEVDEFVLSNKSDAETYLNKTLVSINIC